MNRNHKATVDPLLITTHFVTYIERAEHLKESARIWALTKHVEKAVEQAVKQFGSPCEGSNAGVYAFKGSTKPTNAGRCKVCGGWVSAQNGPDIIDGLGIGAMHDDEYFCWEHLPEDSEWLRSLPRMEHLD